MSADNYIYLDQKTFEVWECVASCVSGLVEPDDLQKQKVSLIGKGKSLKEALEIANKASEKTEYGIWLGLWCK
jgi:hypothetical protein